MAPLFALLLFAGLEQGPMTAPFAENTMNFRLVVDVPEEKIMVDINQIQTNSDGTRNADLYVTFAAEPAIYELVRTRFNCQARSVATVETAAYDRQFRFLGQAPATYPIPIETGTVGEGLLNFVCANALIWEQAPYYGGHVRDAIGKADPRFR